MNVRRSPPAARLSTGLWNSPPITARSESPWSIWVTSASRTSLTGRAPAPSAPVGVDFPVDRFPSPSAALRRAPLTPVPCAPSRLDRGSNPGDPRSTNRSTSTGRPRSRTRASEKPPLSLTAAPRGSTCRARECT